MASRPRRVIWGRGERLARADGVSINHFVATAVAEKLAAMNTAAFFAGRRDQADFEAFDRIMRRTGGEPSRPEDSLDQPETA